MWEVEGGSCMRERKEVVWEGYDGGGVGREVCFFRRDSKN